MHAVIVDPSRVVLRLIEGHFTERGDQVTMFSDSAEALEKVKNDETVNVLITSLEVSPISGLELCWRARLAADNRRPLYIAVMSTVSDAENLSQALDCGADDLIPKPVSRQLLHARLRMAARLHNAQRELVRLAETDTLTEVYNRGAFFRRVDAILLEADSSEGIWAIMFDIDHFKKVNDTHGHHAGDKVIKAAAGEAWKIKGVVGRLGGEEFAILVRGPKKKEQVLQIAEDLRLRCAALVFEGEDGPFQVTCSLGVSQWIEGDSADGLLKRADMALYESKAGGRNQVNFAENRHAKMPELKSPVRAAGRS